MNLVQNSPHAAGTVGIISGELARYTPFAQSLMKLLVPEGTAWYWAQGGSIAKNCNRLIQGMKGDWLWIIGDDHTFSPDLVMRLLDRQVDVVVPLCSMRATPFMPVVYTPNPERPGRYELRQWSDLPNSGLVSVIDDRAIRTGQAGMLIRRHVLEKIAGPYWFEYARIIPDEPGEDLWFCEKILAAGFTVWLDCDAVLGHTGVMTVVPTQQPGHGWRLVFDLGRRMQLRTTISRDGIVPDGYETADESRMVESVP